MRIRGCCAYLLTEIEYGPSLCVPRQVLPGNRSPSERLATSLCPETSTTWNGGWGGGNMQTRPPPLEAYLFCESRGLPLLLVASAVLSCPLQPAHPSLCHRESATVTSLFSGKTSREWGMWAVVGIGVWHPVACPSASFPSRVNPGPMASRLSLVLLYARQGCHSYLLESPSPWRV